MTDARQAAKEKAWQEAVKTYIENMGSDIVCDEEAMALATEAAAPIIEKAERERQHEMIEQLAERFFRTANQLSEEKQWGDSNRYFAYAAGLRMAPHAESALAKDPADG